MKTLYLSLNVFALLKLMFFLLQDLHKLFPGASVTGAGGIFIDNFLAGLLFLGCSFSLNSPLLSSFSIPVLESILVLGVVQDFPRLFSSLLFLTLGPVPLPIVLWQGSDG